MNINKPVTHHRLIRNRSGFTIVELLIVIVVIGILAAITVVAFNGVTARANDAIVNTDFSGNMKRVQLFNAVNGKMPTSNDLANAPASDDYKVKVSKRSTYSFYGYCSGTLNGQTEIIMTAGTADRHQFYTSSLTGVIKDASSDYALSSATVGEYKCFDYLQSGSSTGEFRNMIHRDGGVEAGYITVSSK